MTHPILTSAPHHGFPSLAFLGDLTLKLARIHEISGPARLRLAMMIAASVKGDIFWISPAWQRHEIMCAGIRPLLDPARITFISPRREADILWTMEESLRTGIIPLVIAELPEPLALTPVRRLHLAAEARTEGRGLPLGLLLTAQGASAGVETRWHFSATHQDLDDHWLLQRLRARMAPPAAWTVKGNQDGFKISPLRNPAPV